MGTILVNQYSLNTGHVDISFLDDSGQYLTDANGNRYATFGLNIDGNTIPQNAGVYWEDPKLADAADNQTLTSQKAYTVIPQLSGRFTMRL